MITVDHLNQQRPHKLRKIIPLSGDHIYINNLTLIDLEMFDKSCQNKSQHNEYLLCTYLQVLEEESRVTNLSHIHTNAHTSAVSNHLLLQKKQLQSYEL